MNTIQRPSDARAKKKAEDYAHIALICESKADFHAALEWFLRALHIYTRLHGSTHAITANAAANVARVSLLLHQYEQALAYATQACDARTASLGRLNPFTLEAMFLMAEAHAGLEQYNTAVNMHLRLISLRERTIGRSHPDTIASYNATAITYARMERADLAMRFLSQALLLCEEQPRVLGGPMALTLRNRGHVHTSMKAYTTALEDHQHALRCAKESFGNDNLETAAIATYLAAAHMRLKQFPPAIELLEFALQTHVRLLGAMHAYPASIHKQIGEVYLIMGEKEKALSSFLHAIHTYRHIHSNPGDTLVQLYAQVSALYHDMGDTEAAQKWGLRALKPDTCLREDTFAADLYLSTADTCYSHEEWQNALTYYEKALQIYQADGAHSNSARCHRGTARVFETLGRRKEALQEYEHALALQKDGDGAAETLCHIGMLYHRMGQLDFAYGALEKAQRLCANTTNTALAALIYSNLATTCLALMRPDDCIVNNLHALELYQTVRGAKHPDNAALHYNIAAAYEHRGDYKSALTHYQQALALLDGLPVTNGMINCLRRIAACYTARGKVRKAREFTRRADEAARTLRMQ